MTEVPLTVCVCACVRACVRACVCACMRACVCISVCVCVCVATVVARDTCAYFEADSSCFHKNKRLLSECIIFI